MSAALPENVRVLPGVTPSFLTSPPIDPELLAPHMYDLARLARDVELARRAIAASEANGAKFRPGLTAFLETLIPQLQYRADQIEADILEAQGITPEVA